ncbi:hypothetical protein D3C72_1257070 [compost metagenome]
MQCGLVIAVQVEHDVGVDGHAQQGFLQGFRIRARPPGGDGGARMLAYQCHVGLRILSQLASQPGFQFIGHVAVGAVEIDARGQVEAAEWRAMDGLRQADRVGGRHQDDFAMHFAGRFQRQQFAAQKLRHQHARHLVRVQGRLDIHLLAAAASGGRGAEVEAAQLAGHAGVRGGDGMLLYLHGGRPGKVHG